ncbi:MAG: winged helix-turn-helix transcriptional regulator [Deltaproteobacteria bacterium]|nr:winged helix-turn-helix transcriptional regulator [Deltaproteobacteria bacterium]
MKRAQHIGQARPRSQNLDHHALSGPGFTSQSFERAVRLLRAIGDEGRLRLMEILTREEACVGDIAQTLGERVSTISERLRRLRDAGLVVRRRKGKHKFYSVADSHITEMVLNTLSHATEDES